MEWIWKSVLIITVGTLILRVAGRKSISQMTLAQTVIMVAIGSLLIQPVAGEDLWTTFGVGVMLVITLIVMEYLQIKFDFMERFLTGRAIPIIVNGQLQEDELRKVRFTVDQLEMKLRQQNVMSIEDVENATLEANGQVGCELKQDKQPATQKDISDIKQQLSTILEALHARDTSEGRLPHEKGSLFNEVFTQNHDHDPPDRLL